MLSNKLARTTLTAKNLSAFVRSYTVIVERYKTPPIMKKGIDQRKRDLRSIYMHYKFVDCLHNKKWGSVELILTEYVEGIGHKGELVTVPRHDAYYHLLPSRLAVYPTEEYLKMYEKNREDIASKAKVSPHAMRTKETLESMILQIPVNMEKEWQLNRDFIRIALRYNVN